MHHLFEVDYVPTASMEFVIIVFSQTYSLSLCLSFGYGIKLHI